MATRIKFLFLDQVSRSSKYPLLRNSDEYPNVQNPSSLAYNDVDTASQPFTDLLSPYRGLSGQLDKKGEIYPFGHRRSFSLTGVVGTWRGEM